jgi:lipopolysaccharide export system protein LptA
MRFFSLPVRASSALLFASALWAAPAPVPTTPLQDTVIEAGTAEVVSSATETTFHLGKGVKVTGTNLKLTCDTLVVVAKRTGDPKATLGKQENFKSLVATGHVRILQNDREANCERAEILPGEDKVVLTGNPRIRSLDGQYQASGDTMTLYRGQRRAVMDSGSDGRPTFTLPPLQDLGYEKEAAKKKPAAAAAPATPVK